MGNFKLSLATQALLLVHFVRTSPPVAEMTWDCSMQLLQAPQWGTAD